MGRGRGFGRSRRAAIQTSSAGSPAESPEGRPDASPAARRRRARGAWVLLPLVAAALYAGLATLLARSPTLAEMVPDDAIATWRFKDVATFDELRTPADAAGQVVRHTQSQVLGAEINLPALPGIDLRRPLLTVTLDPSRRADPGFYVLPVDDAAKVRETFASPDLLERHARAVAVHGRWVAAGWDLLAVDRAGAGHGVYPEERGEDWAVAVDWPKFVDAALRPESVSTEPVKSVLVALGFDPASGRVEEGEFRIANAGRVPLVRDAWSRVEFHAFPDHVRVELWPAADALVKVFGDDAKDAPLTVGYPIVAPPDRAQVWLRTVSAWGRRALALTLGHAGLRWPTAVGKEGFQALRLDAPGSLVVYAEPAGGATPSWTLVLDGEKDTVPDLVAFGLPAPTPGTSLPLPAGAAALTTPYGPAPAGEVVVRDEDLPPHAVRTVALGVDAGTAVERRRRERSSAGDHWREGTPRRGLVATFGISQLAAQRLLGPALSKMGLLSSLAGGAIEGRLAVENGRLVLEAYVTRAP